MEGADGGVERKGKKSRRVYQSCILMDSKRRSLFLDRKVYISSTYSLNNLFFYYADSFTIKESAEH